MAIEDIKDSLSTHFFQTEPSPYVNGIAIGLLPDENPPSEQLDGTKKVLVFVARSVPSCELAAIKKVVSDQAGTRYATIPTSEFVGLRASTGSSAGNYAPFQFNLPQVSAGTLGAVVKAGGKEFFLFSNHVLAHNGRAPVGTDVVAPATRDLAVGRVVGSVSLDVNLKPPPWPLKGTTRALANKVDCALAEAIPGSSAAATQVTILPSPPLLSPVTKTGRTTGTTTSTIRVLDWDGWIVFSFGTYYFAAMMGTHGPDEFAKPGDSGSLALVPQPDGRGVGLLTARAYTFDPSGQLDGFVILMCSLQLISDSLQSVRGFPPGPITFWRD